MDKVILRTRKNGLTMITYKSKELYFTECRGVIKQLERIYDMDLYAIGKDGIAKVFIGQHKTIEGAKKFHINRVNRDLE